MNPLKNILFLNGSPRKKGNIDTMLGEIIAAIDKRAITEKIDINDLDFRPCQGCGGCDESGRCILEDDLMPIYKKISDADVIIFGSPIHFGSLSAQSKMLIDRMQAFWVAKIKLKNLDIKPKKGFLVLVEGSAEERFLENARQIIKNFFAVINAQYSGEFFYAKIEEKGEISDFPGIKKQAKDIAEKALIS